MGRTVEWLHRLLTSDDELDADAVQQQCIRSGSQLAAQCQHGEVVTISGRIQAITVASPQCRPGLTAELYDGSAIVLLQWLGRRSVPGLAVGQWATVKGRLRRPAESGGVPVMMNPYFELDPQDASSPRLETSR